jgi:hypothetical protein
LKTYTFAKVRRTTDSDIDPQLCGILDGVPASSQFRLWTHHIYLHCQIEQYMSVHQALEQSLGPLSKHEPAE